MFLSQILQRWSSANPARVQISVGVKTIDTLNKTLDSWRPCQIPNWLKQEKSGLFNASWNVGPVIYYLFMLNCWSDALKGCFLWLIFFIMLNLNSKSVISISNLYFKLWHHKYGIYVCLFCFKQLNILTVFLGFLDNSQ